MPRAEITRTTALYPSAVFLQWDIDSDESGSFFVDVARSGNPLGPWETIATGLRDAYNIVDDKFNLPPSHNANGKEGLNLFSLSRALYYQVTITPPSGIANTFLSDPRPVEPGLDTRTRLFKRKILHDEAVGYRRLNGIPLILLKRRRWGVRCDICYDPITKESTQEHCLSCFGTSFQGGYWAPVAIRGRREASATQTQMTSSGDSDMQLNDFNILDYPLVDYKDLIIDLLRNDRYQVQRVHATEMKGVPVHQKLAASLLGRNSIEYKIVTDLVNTSALY